MTGRPRRVSDDEVFGQLAAVLGRDGPAGVTLAAVGAAAGLSAPALVQRFGSKRGMLVAFAEHEGGAVERAFARARRRAPTPLAALDAALTALVASITSRRALANNLAFLQMDLTDDDLRGHATAYSRAFRAEVGRLLDEAVAAGDLGATDTATLATAVWTTYNGALVTWAIDGKGRLPAWLRHQLGALLKPYGA